MVFIISMILYYTIDIVKTVSETEHMKLRGAILHAAVPGDLLFASATKFKADDVFLLAYINQNSAVYNLNECLWKFAYHSLINIQN